MPIGSIEHGSASFLELEGRPVSEVTTNRLSLWLGHPIFGRETGYVREDFGRAVAASPERHMITIAPTRSGKGTSVIIPNLLAYPASVFVIDPKGENAWVTAQRRRQLGQEVFILDPWNEIGKRYGQETSARFNPMAELDPSSPDFTDDLGALADALIINQGKDPHWDDSSRELVAGLIAFLVENPETRDGASLGQMRQLLTLPRSQIVALIEGAVKQGGVAARKLSRFRDDTNEIASIVSTAVTQTAFLDNATLADSMSASDFDFGRLASGDTSVFLVLPVDKLGPYGRWLRLLVTIAIRAIARAQRPPYKVLFLLDEFGTIGRLAAVEQAFGLMGGMGICLWPFVQDLNQLKRDYPDSWETFIANAEAVQAFSVKDNFSSEYLSRLMGVTTQEVVSQLTLDKRRGFLGLGGDANYRSMHDRTFQRSLMFADEIRALRSDWQLLLYRGRPVLAALMPYFATSVFNGLYRPLPGFAAVPARPVGEPTHALSTLHRAVRSLIMLLAIGAVLGGLGAALDGGLSARGLTPAAVVSATLAAIYLSYPLWTQAVAGTWLGRIAAGCDSVVAKATFFVERLTFAPVGWLFALVIVGVFLAFVPMNIDVRPTLSDGEQATLEHALRARIALHFSGVAPIENFKDYDIEVPGTVLEVKAWFSALAEPKKNPGCLMTGARWTRPKSTGKYEHGFWPEPPRALCSPNSSGR